MKCCFHSYLQLQIIFVSLHKTYTYTVNTGKVFMVEKYHVCNLSVIICYQTVLNHNMYGADLITVDKVSMDRWPFEFNWVSRDWSIDLRGEEVEKELRRLSLQCYINKSVNQFCIFLVTSEWRPDKGKIKFVLLRYWWGLLLPQNCSKLVDAFPFYMYESMPASPYRRRSVFNIISHFECHKCRYTLLIDTTWCCSCHSDRRIELPLFSTVCTELLLHGNIWSLMLFLTSKLHLQEWVLCSERSGLLFQGERLFISRFTEGKKCKQEEDAANRYKKTDSCNLPPWAA